MLNSEFVNWYSSRVAVSPITTRLGCFLDTDAIESPLLRFGQTHMAKFVLFPLWDFQRLFQFRGALLKVVVEDEMRELILEAMLASL